MRGHFLFPSDFRSCEPRREDVNFNPVERTARPPLCTIDLMSRKREKLIPNFFTSTGKNPTPEPHRSEKGHVFSGDPVNFCNGLNGSRPHYSRA